MDIKKEYEKFFGRKKNDLCVHDAEDVINFAKHYQSLQLQKKCVSGSFCNIIGKELFRKSPITKNYTKIKVKSIEARFHERLHSMYFVIISENNIEYIFHEFEGFFLNPLDFNTLTIK